jgi:hypothetical protein
MNSGGAWFNTFLLVTLWVTAMACWAGCRSQSRSKSLAALSLHLEVNPDASGWNEPVTVGRSTPFVVNVEKRPFLTEQELLEAVLVETNAMVALKLQFGHRGTLLLDQYSSAYRGKRAAILARWDQTVRWLAAPRMEQRITNGVLVFTPDANRSEAERLVQALNKTVRAIGQTRL